MKAGGLWFKSLTPNLGAVWPYAKHFIVLNLNFLLCRKGKMSPFQMAIGYREDECLKHGLAATPGIFPVSCIGTYF